MSAVKRHFFDLYTTKNDDDIIIEQKRKDMEDRMYKSYLSTLFRVTDGLFALVKTSPSESYSIVINKGLKEVPPGLLATAIPALLANRLESPSKKLSKL